MSRVAVLAFAGFAYLLFFATFLYLVAFVGDSGLVHATVDRGPAAPLGAALIGDIGLIALFGVQHSIMARPWFKQSWTRIVPPAAERSVYVVLASLVLILMFALWRPIPGWVWQAGPGWLEWAIWGLFGLGWLIVLLSTFMISHFELFGLSQAWRNLRERAAVAPRFHTPLFYRLVRHPLYTGFVIAFWATPAMSWGHLLLAAGMTAYILIAIVYEERDLVDAFGDTYRDYRTRVGKLFPGIGRVSR